MPYFKWRGITLDGRYSTGTAFAHSAQDLDALLLKRDIALIKTNLVKKRWILRSVPRRIIIDFFKHLAVLLEAGILLPQALTIVQSQCDHGYFQHVIGVIVECVNTGKSLSHALQGYSFFTPLMVQMVYVGQESGNLALLLNLLTNYLDSMLSFNKQIRTAALMPLITVCFFIVIAGGIIIGIIPQFSSLFATFNQELPWLTRMLVECGTCVYGLKAIPMIFGISLVIMGTKWFIRSYKGKIMFDRWILYIPGINTLILDSSLACFLHTLATLLAGGIQLPVSLHIAQQSINNTKVHASIYFLITEIQSGASLSTAMGQHPQHIFTPDVVAMTTVGEESGTMQTMVERIAQRYQERVKRSLKVITTVFQPLLLIILGLLTALLVFAVYMPLLQFSYIIN